MGTASTDTDGLRTLFEDLHSFIGSMVRECKAKSLVTPQRFLTQKPQALKIIQLETGVHVSEWRNQYFEKEDWVTQVIGGQAYQFNQASADLDCIPRFVVGNCISDEKDRTHVINMTNWTKRS